MVRFDLHSHTTYSKHHFWGRDALNTPQEMVKSAMKRGLSGLAITDHQTVKGSLVAQEYVRSRKLKFKIITGLEIKTTSGDLLGLGIKKDVPDNLSVEESIKRIHDLGGLAVAPHPYGEFGMRTCLKEKAIKADAIEVFNAGSCRAFQNKKALDLAEKYKKSFSAGSDAHYYRDVGNAGIICEGDPLEAIRKNKVKIFGMYTPLNHIAMLTMKKFKRSIKYRILRKDVKIV
ncbi:MAG: PHP domain-containing protein [Candidatus Aenigmarchaeota archaeon]|nr:PHP domain-containing protein [Candidatus Aenigmarchaeota archaeon]